jgi:pyruvate-ferredoxin/flavodoxin oxidoreductase
MQPPLSCLQAIPLLKQAISKSYSKQGDKVVAQNHAAVDAALSAVVKIDIPASWASAAAATDTIAGRESADGATDSAAAAAAAVSTPTALAAKAAAQRLGLGDFYGNVMQPMLALQADSLPVSALKAGNIMPPGEL